MNDIITLSFNIVEICILVVTVLVTVVFMQLRVKENITNSKTRLLTEVNDDLKGFHNNTKASKNLSTSAKEAKGVVVDSMSEEELENILSPIFTKIMKASNNGDSGVYIHGRDWYYRDNIKYKEAGERLESLGYSIWRGGNTLGVIIKW